MIAAFRPLAFTLLTAALLLPAAWEAQAKPPRERSPQVVLEKRGASLRLIAPDRVQLASQDLQRDGDKSRPIRYGRVLRTGVIDAMAGAGTWTRLATGDWSWRLDVVATGATSLEFGFSRLYLPHGASLVIRATNGKQMLAPLSDADNPRNGVLHTAMLQGDRATLELRVPANKRERVELALSRVVWGYRDPFAAAQAKSGSCNVDTICPEGDAWREQIASVAGYAFSESDDQLMCTGTLLNTGNTAEDTSHPRFFTAYHCVSDQATADTMVLYWGYESPTCRAAGSAENGTQLPLLPNSRAVQLGGATLITADRITDITALELNTPIPAEAQAWYSGWDRSGAVPPGAVNIHHPGGHEKRITLEADPLSTMANCIISDGDDNTHWRVGPYEAGTTEGGSSGSGLWNSANGLLVGVLSGGTAGCGAPDGYDCFGRLSAAWDVEGTGGTTIGQAFNRSGANPTTMPGKGSCDAPQVSLSSNAFSTAPEAGQSFELRASASGGAGNYTFLWDTDGDGVIEREGVDRLTLSFPSARSHNVWVRVRDGEGCVGSTSRALEIVGPQLSVSQIGARQQVCGNGNGRIDPGERYRLPITFTNTGTVNLPAGARALFEAASSLPGNGISNQAGYEGAAQCSYAFIDIADGANATPPLETYVANGNTYGPRDDARSSEITLGGNGFSLYGQTYTKAVMSTNGYVSFDPEETGANWWVSCDGELDYGAKGPQLRPYHDDMVVGTREGAGLRYRYFDTCPRMATSGKAQGCHVFQWTGMGYYVGVDEIEGDFDFEAVAYAQTGEVAYQYHVAAPDQGDLANIGLVGVGGADPLNLYCESYQQPAKAEQALCIHSPQALAAAGSAMRLESPTVALPAMAAGASATVSLPVAIRADAACSAPLALDYIATAAARSYSTQGSRHSVGEIKDDCSVVNTCPLSIPAIATREGNFFSPWRSGNGFNYHDYGGIWYTAASDHTPLWLGTQGAFEDNLFSAPLWKVSVPAGALPPGVLPIQAERVGQLRLARVDTTHLMMAWDMTHGGRGAELLQMMAAEVPRPNPDHTEHWYPPSQSGWGADVESAQLGAQRYDAVFAYFYDASGQPRWVLSDGYIQNGHLLVNGYRPHCPGCMRFDDWQSRTRPAGSLVIRWSDADSATLSTDITLPAPLQGEWKRSEVPLVPIRGVQP
ncbi:MAG: hypothetical protein KDI69_10275 [Xanthomonadales bacterium]|nr:hypothetical protein [Xanthomonadales bacterium]